MEFTFGHSSNDGFFIPSFIKVNISNFSFPEKFLFSDTHRRNVDIPPEVLYNHFKLQPVFYGKPALSGHEIVLI